MSEKQWYEDIPRDEFEGKHVRVVVDSGTVFEGRLELWDSKMVVVCMGSLSEGIPVLRAADDGLWKPLEGLKRLDLVWDERDWEQIDANGLRAGDAVVANGRLYKLSWANVGPPQVVTDTPGHMLIDLSLVSCALRRKVNVPAEPGFYKDTLGEFWARAAKSTEGGTWRSVEPDALDQPAKSDKYMANLMPLTPVHFVDGRAPEPGDELASVMRITSKGVTFTTEAA